MGKEMQNSCTKVSPNTLAWEQQEWASGASFSTEGVCECDIAYRRSVVVLCIFYMILCNRMHILSIFNCGALPLSCVPVRVTRGALVAHRDIGMFMLLLAAEPRSPTGTLFPTPCHCGTILLTLYSIVWDWRFSRAGIMIFYWTKLLAPFLSSTVFPLSFSFSRWVLWGWGLWTNMA